MSFYFHLNSIIIVIYAQKIPVTLRDQNSLQPTGPKFIATYGTKKSIKQTVTQLDLKGAYWIRQRFLVHYLIYPILR